MEQYRKLDELRLVAVTDCHNETGVRTAQRFGLQSHEVPEKMFARDDIEIVHIATPPHTHHELAMKALAAGKHVLCEKPLATTVADAREMLSAAEQARRVLAVNLIMRYDPLTQPVARVIQQRLLGEPIHAFLENYAQDERLPPNHWFWDPKKSGGMFIEHGVHFFDLFECWLGRAQVLCAFTMPRPGNETIIEQVQCLCRFDPQVLATFYHGFHQSDRMDRQEFRIVCERGDLRMVEWLPTALRVDATLTERDADAVAALLPNSQLRQIKRYESSQRQVYSRHRVYEVDALYTIESHAGMPKGELYGHVLRELMRDQIKFINDPSHKRILDERAGLRSLEIAEQATRLAG
jgi:predicted dehydrogenase